MDKIGDAAIKPGLYRHYKNQMLYYVEGLVKHTEEETIFVHYRDSKGNSFIRPFDMFVENVGEDGKMVPRFTYVGEDTLNTSPTAS